MRIKFSTALIAAGLLLAGSTAFAQDEIGAEGTEASPEAGDVGGEVGGDAPTSEGLAGDPIPVDDAAGPGKPISVALLLGYGISLEDFNPWGLGFGLRGGYNLDKIFLGARFVYYLGGTEELPDGFGNTIEIDYNLWELGIEGGYDLDVASGFIVRPGVGLGLAGFSAGDASETEVYFAFGASGLYDVAPDIFVGADARFQFVLADESAKALILLATGGMRF